MLCWEKLHQTFDIFDDELVGKHVICFRLFFVMIGLFVSLWRDFTEFIL